MFKNSLRVLFYHRVNNHGDRFGIETEIFEEQVRYLRNEYRIISLSEYAAMIEHGKWPKNSLLITFDDGYRDNYIFAYTILGKYSVPAAIFLATDFIDNRIWLWQDIFRYILETTPERTVSLTICGSPYSFNLDDDRQLYTARRGLYDELRILRYDERICRLKRLATSLQVDLPDLPTDRYAPLSWGEIREMSENNIEFGAHTCKHEILSGIDKNSVYTELSKSKKRIEEELRSKVIAFAYPNGQEADFSPDTPMLIEQCGYKLAFTTIHGMNRRSTDRYLHRRLSAGNAFNNNFKQIVSGVTTLKGSLKNKLGLFT